MNINDIPSEDIEYLEQIRYEYVREAIEEGEGLRGLAVAAMGSASQAHAGLMQSQDLCHGLAQLSGWWTDLTTGEPVDPDAVFAEKLALIHSEASEALEGHRKGLKDHHLPHRDMVEVELADLVIRTFDLAGALHLDLAGAIIEKLAYNQHRADHKLENRKSDNGKKY